MLRLLASTLLLVLLACTSDADRYRKLDQDLLISQAELGNAEQHYKDLSLSEKWRVNDSSAAAETVAFYDTLETLRAKTATLQREMNKFMAGR